jgi:hypothetical protein
MELYQSSDIKLLENNIEGILNKLNDKRMSLFGPNIDEIKQITAIIQQFIKDNKRKVYGGYALNLYIKEKNPNDAIYSDNQMPPPDIEFYSPQPIQDLIELCNLLGANGTYNKVTLDMEDIYLWHNKSNISSMDAIKNNDYCDFLD